MKEKIIDLLENTVGISPSGLSLMNLDTAAEQTMQLMCDKIVSHLAKRSGVVKELFFLPQHFKGLSDDMGFTVKQIQKSLEKLK